MSKPGGRKPSSVSTSGTTGPAPGSDVFRWEEFDPSMLPAGPESPLALELITYRDRLDEMMADHEGEFVVIRGARIAGYHPDRKRALEAAFREFGRGPALVKQVVEGERVRRIGGVGA